ncbi:glycoside hydrolase family 3 protein [Coprinopsis marcescibilis]|uniref:beta-glucosidase n=1 Tax=Coprinopsis marcescibilis TaxID=230819 RepID=A0A5C3KIM2_COPMA|nr:glycoside hydrolase family 3 protein [Coprinopsis marcescibilis]
MPPSDFANANIEEIVEKLTLDEAIQLTAGVGFWHTHAIERLGIPAIKVSDGPNGIRGNHFFMGTPAKCLPSSTALGATWDPELVKVVGLKLIAEEAKLRAASLVLAPTCNIQRNPLGGRSFESFSEDPYLSGQIAAAYVNGIQSGGIGTTIKHFVQVLFQSANDKENDRFGYDSIVSPRALREIYLMPFMLAQKLAQPWAYMTSYNRVNGLHCSENEFLLKKVLRDEWKFDGMVMSDWFGTYSVDLGVKAGLDLEMPGTNKWRTLEQIGRSVNARKLTVGTIKARAENVLKLVQKCAQGAPEILDGDGEERTVESEEDKELMRDVAAKSIVLLKNQGGVLPLDPSALKKVAIIGGNAKATVLSGGGSAALKASYFISPFQGILEGLGPNVEVTYSEGARTFMNLPTLENDLVTESGERGWTGTWHAHTSDDSLIPVEEPIETRLIDETRMFISTSTPKGITKRWTLRLRGYIQKERDTNFEFGLTVAGRAKLYVDGNVVIDNWTRQRRGESFFGLGTVEEKGVYPLVAGRKHEVLVELCDVRGPADGDEDETLMDRYVVQRFVRYHRRLSTMLIKAGVRLGGADVQDPEEAMAEAVALAKDADVVIAVVGLNADWETEGYDRTTLALPGRTDELISKVAAVNEKTVVVTQAGSAITLPWVDEVPAVVHAWYLGNATGAAIADVLFGKVNPSGKLSLTFPKAETDVPSYGHFHSENGKVRYAEDLYVGYKHYIHRGITPLFAFGHGLSYTSFQLSDLVIGQVEQSSEDISVQISVKVTNVGRVAGSEVVQVYVSAPTTSALSHAPLQLRAFGKARDLAPGASAVVSVALDRYAVSYWGEQGGRWVVERGKYAVRVGSASDRLVLEGVLEVGRAFEWSGL